MLQFMRPQVEKATENIICNCFWKKSSIFFHKSKLHFLLLDRILHYSGSESAGVPAGVWEALGAGTRISARSCFTHYGDYHGPGPCESQYSVSLESSPCYCCLIHGLEIIKVCGLCQSWFVSGWRDTSRRSSGYSRDACYGTNRRGA